jgi:hypothetical protein
MIATMVLSPLATAEQSPTERGRVSERQNTNKGEPRMNTIAVKDGTTI